MSLSRYGTSIDSSRMSYQSYQAHSLIASHNQTNHGELLIDDSISGNRLVQYQDGTLEVIPQSPAYVFGEKVVRPLLDGAGQLGARTFRFLKEGLVSLDRSLSEMLNFMPQTEAVEVSGATVDVHEIADPHAIEFNKDIVSEWALLNLNPTDYVTHMTALPYENQIVLSQDSEFNANFLKLKIEVNDLKAFINDIESKYKNFQKFLHHFYSPLQGIENQVKEILDDIKTNNEKSNYAPESKSVIVLSFTDYCEDFKKVEAIVKDDKEINEILKNGLNARWDCGEVRVDTQLIHTSASNNALSSSTNPVVVQITDSLEVLIRKLGMGLFEFLNLPTNRLLTFEEFRMVFNEISMNQLSKNLSTIKNEIKRKLDNEKLNLTNELLVKLKEVKINILMTVDNIFKKHKEIVEITKNLAIVNINYDSTKKYVIGWDVKSTSVSAQVREIVWAPSRRFRFRIAKTQEKLRDE